MSTVVVSTKLTMSALHRRDLTEVLHDENVLDEYIIRRDSPRAESTQESVSSSHKEHASQRGQAALDDKLSENAHNEADTHTSASSLQESVGSGSGRHASRKPSRHAWSDTVPETVAGDHFSPRAHSSSTGTTNSTHSTESTLVSVAGKDAGHAKS